jgi:hypothetical protein
MVMLVQVVSLSLQDNHFWAWIVFGIQEHNFMQNINLQLLELSIGRPIGLYIFLIY